MNSNIHPTALVDAQAKVHDSAIIGAYSIIGPNVTIGSGTRVGQHTIIEGHTEIGQDNDIGHHILLGGIPQDKKYAGEPTRLTIGDRNTIREFTSVHIGTTQDIGLTQIGDDNWIMGYVHIAHDCRIGNQTILASNAQLAGHVEVQDFAIIGGMTGVHQFVKVGAHAMVGGGSILYKDIIPFVMVAGVPAKTHGLNSEGLKRRGFDSDRISGIKRAYKLICRQELPQDELVAQLDLLYSEFESAAPDLDLMKLFVVDSQRGYSK